MTPNSTEQKPLYTLSIAEFITLTKTLVNEAIKDILKKKDDSIAETISLEENHMDISGLAKFLKCSKVSIHKYKKKGLPYYRIGRKILFKRDEILAFMKSIKTKKT